ncbi:Sensor histidine kinase ComP [Andreprevotia sp. IGB-42]|uniref:sensor histidine kinase n=1 Tax=Andreprevotia sp. IGB-42 TaxID=2497473 RepID=UPI001357ECBF|nr:histidine kinase [Andreprevotia sp. IGB-42]KAF0811654.1 Sensor histidine kinase ComP [Andreprevotia sp. IGB-42]
MLKAAAVVRKLLETLQSIGRKGQVRLALCVVAIIVAATLADSWLQLALKENVKILAARERIIALHELNLSLVIAESAERGFLINANDRYLRVYDQAVGHARNQLGTLEDKYRAQAALPDAPEGRATQVQMLSTQTNRKLTELDLSLGFARRGDFARARETVGAEADFQQSQQLIRDIQSLINIETIELAQLRSQRLTMITILRVAIFLGWMMVLAVSIWVLLWMSGEIESGNRNANRLSERQEELDALVQERTEQLENLSLEYQASVESDRATLARELHDELGSILTATKMDISWIQRQLKEVQPAITEKLQRMLRNLDQGIQFKRRVVQDLHPTLLTTFGLIPSLRSLIEEAAQRNQWTLNLVLPEDSVDAGEVLNLICYRIVQESLNNSTKYARAAEVSVSLLIDDEHIKLDIEDNGVGVDLSTLTGESHGLRGIRQRVMATGGRLDIQSEPGNGFHTSVLLPLKARHRKKTAPFGAV